MPDYWNNLPKAAYTGRENVSAAAVLAAWGIADWGNRERFYEGNYVGWCMVHLPVGWMLSLEGHNFYLLDQHGQVRGEIYDAFERPKGDVIIITDEDIEEAGISKAEWEEAFPPGEVRKEPEKPRMELRTAIRFKTSFTLGNTYSFWAENPLGQQIFSISDEPVTDEEYNEKIPRLRKRVFDWMGEHYPGWEDHTTYWDAFVETDKRWSGMKDAIAAAAYGMLADKSDDDLRTLQAHMGRGEKYTDYVAALQSELSSIFAWPDDTPPFCIAAHVAWHMKLEMDQRIGRARY